MANNDLQHALKAVIFLRPYGSTPLGDDLPPWALPTLTLKKPYLPKEKSTEAEQEKYMSDGNPTWSRRPTYSRTAFSRPVLSVNRWSSGTSTVS